MFDTLMYFAPPEFFSNGPIIFNIHVISLSKIVYSLNDLNSSLDDISRCVSKCRPTGYPLNTILMDYIS